MRALSRIIVASMALVAAAPALVAQTPPAPIVKVEGLRQISARVHIIPDNSVPGVPNVGFVVGDRAALVIDTGLGPPNGAAVYEVAKRLAAGEPWKDVAADFAMSLREFRRRFLGAKRGK